MRWIAIAMLVGGLAGCKKKAMSGAEWRAEKEPALVELFCGPAWYFRQCFDVDAALCKTTAGEAIKRCFDALTIPDSVDAETHRVLASRVGQCAGDAYENALQSKRRPGGKCDDPSAWAPPQVTPAR